MTEWYIAKCNTLHTKVQENFLTIKNLILNCSFISILPPIANARVSTNLLHRRLFWSSPWFLAKPYIFWTEVRPVAAKVDFQVPRNLIHIRSQNFGMLLLKDINQQGSYWHFPARKKTPPVMSCNFWFMRAIRIHALNGCN